jgi:DNA-binding response OmpR family regulator
MHNDVTRGAGDVLIVDDDPLAVELMVELLTEEGYTVRSAENGLDGWQAIEAAPPVLLLLDLRMPVLCGAELAMRVRAAHYRFPIVILTTTCQLPEALASLDVLYIAKPFELHELLAIVAHSVAPKGAPVITA